MNKKTKKSVESDLVVNKNSDKFYFNFEGKVILNLLVGIIIFFLVYVCLDKQFQEDISTRPLNSDIWFFSKLSAFVSLLLYLVICSSLGRKTADKGYEFEIKYAPIRPILNVLSIFSFVSIGVMLGIFLMILAR